MVQINPERCDCCGRFLSEGAPGVSWGQSWSYDMSGTPDLHDPAFRCSPCTDLHGMPQTNCAPSYPGQGRNPAPPTNPQDER